MFLKLLRYKFNAHRNLFIILSAIALSMSAVGAGAMWLLEGDFVYKLEPEILSVFAGLVCTLLISATYYGLIAYTIATAILLLVQFYRNHFSDEGYLTFTLPATTHQHLLSSFLNILIWTTAAMFHLFICIIIMISPLYISNNYLVETITDLMDFMSASGIELPAVSIPMLGISSLLTVCLLPMLAICIGCVAVKRKKLLASFGIGYGIISTFTISTYILIFLSMVADGYISYEILNADKFHSVLTLLVTFTMQAGVCIGGYFLMHRLVDRKLNLP